jgi:hypothetical protein
LNEDFVDSYDIALSVYHTPLPAYEQYADYPSIYYENDSLSPAKVREVFADFDRAVRQFYIDAQLESFFEDWGKPLYDKLMNEVQAVAPQPEYISRMEDYYGVYREGYTIVVSATSFNGIGKSKTVTSDDGTNIYQIVTSEPDAESDTIDLNHLDSFTIGYTNAEYFREIATHELGHSFLHEPLRETPEIIDQISSLDILFTRPLQANMRNQGYWDWNMCFEEHLVRLGELEIAEQMGNTAFVKEYRETCTKRRGFIYLNTLDELLQPYKSQRDTYPNFASYLPILIAELGKHESQPSSPKP